MKNADFINANAFRVRYKARYVQLVMIKNDIYLLLSLVNLFLQITPNTHTNFHVFWLLSNVV